MAERIAETVVRYRTDQASVQQAVQANQQIDATLKQTAAGASSTALQFASVADAARALNLSDAQVKALSSDTQQLASSANQAAAAQEKLAAASSRVGGGFTATQAASRIAGVGALVGSQAGGAVFPAFAQVAQLGIAFGAVGAAAGVLGLALRGVTDLQQKAAESAKLYASALSQISGEVAGGATTADITESIDNLQRQKNVQQESLDSLALLQDEGKVRLQQFFSGMIDEDTFNSLIGNVNQRLSDLTGGVTTDWSQIDDALAAGQAEIDKTSGSIAFYTAQLGTQAVAENTAAAAAKALADAQVKDAQQALEVDRLTKEQRDERIAQNDRDVNVLTRLIGAGGLSADAVAELAAQITDLNTDTERLKGTNETYADTLAAIEARQQSINDQFDQYSDAIANTGAIQEKLVGLEQDLAQARTDAAEKIGDIVAKTEDRREEIIADAGERREEIEQNTQDAIARIQRDAGREQYTAVASRDALAFAQSQQKAADAISDQQKQEEKQLAQQEKAQAKQLASLQKAQDEQIRSVNQALDKETRLKQNAIFMQEQALIKAQYDEQQIALFGSNNQVMIHTQMWQDFNTIAVTWAANTVNTIRSILGVLGGAGGAGGTQAINQAVDARIAQTIGGRGGFVPSPY